MAVLPAKGVTIKQGSTAILQVRSISGPNITAETADVTTLGDAWRKHKATINDSGELTVVVLFDPDDTTHTTFRALFANQVDSAQAVSTTPESWVLTFTDATPATATFSGIATGLEIGSMEVGGVIEATLTIKLTSLITWA